MDADAVHTYFQPNDTTFDSLNHEPSPELEGDSSCDNPENPPSKKKVIAYVHVSCCMLQLFISSPCMHMIAELLADMNSQLMNLYDGVYQQLPNKNGIALRTHRQCNIATIRRKVQRVSVKYSALNRAKSKKMPSNIRKRYGQKADRLRKTHEVCDPPPPPPQ